MTYYQHPKAGMIFHYLRDLPQLHIGDILKSLSDEEFVVIDTSPLRFQLKDGRQRNAIQMAGIWLRVASRKHAMPTPPDPAPRSPVTVTQRVDYQIHTGDFDGLTIGQVDATVCYRNGKKTPARILINMVPIWVEVADLRKLSKHMADLADALEART